MWVPRVGLLDDQGTPAVYAVRDGKAVRVPVKTGYTDGDWTEILGGLKLGDAVVTAGKVALREGSAVQVIGEPADKARAVARSDAEADGKEGKHRVAAWGTGTPKDPRPGETAWAPGRSALRTPPATP